MCRIFYFYLFNFFKIYLKVLQCCRNSTDGILVIVISIIYYVYVLEYLADATELRETCVWET